MGKIIVMKRTIDWLATSKQFDVINKLMGAGLDWKTINIYYLSKSDNSWRYHPENPDKKDVVSEYNVLKKIKVDIEQELSDLDK